MFAAFVCKWTVVSSKCGDLVTQTKRFAGNNEERVVCIVFFS